MYGLFLSFVLSYILPETCSLLQNFVAFRRAHRSHCAVHLTSPLQTWNTSELESIEENSAENNQLEAVELISEAWNPYRSPLLASDNDWNQFLSSVWEPQQWQEGQFADLFWEQVKLEARIALELEPAAGPQLYQTILSQSSLLLAICTKISHEIETELIPATALKNLFLEQLTREDEYMIRLDLEAVAARSPTVDSAMDAILFHNGFHALVCYRVGHRLWKAGREGLAYYMQSTVSRKYSADIHPACRMGSGIFLRVGGGVVIGETAVIGNDVSIMEGVTLGGTGKESGDRHPKVGNGVILQDGATVLGNIPVGDGSIVCAKSIVTKPVPPLAIVSGVPARVKSYRQLSEVAFDDDLQRHLMVKYLETWRELSGLQDPLSF